MVAAEQAIAHARQVHDVIPEGAAAILAGDATEVAEINLATSSVQAALDRLGEAKEALREIGAEALGPQPSESFQDVLRRMEQLIAQRALILPTLQWRERLEAAREHPLAGPLAAAAEAGRIAPERLTTALAWCVARRAASLHQATKAGKILRLGGDDLERMRDRFRRADAAVLDANAAQLREALLKGTPPSGSASGPRAD